MFMQIWKYFIFGCPDILGYIYLQLRIIKLGVFKVGVGVMYKLTNIRTTATTFENIIRQCSVMCFVYIFCNLYFYIYKR